MSNIEITWSSDQRKLIADLQQQILLLQQAEKGVAKVAASGKSAGESMGNAYRDVNKELDRLGRVAASSFKAANSPMDAHLSRLKELRVLYRMGKIDAEQFAGAQAASLKKSYGDRGLTDKLRQIKADREKDLADAATAAQKHSEIVRNAIVKELQQRRAARQEFEGIAIQEAEKRHQIIRESLARELTERRNSADAWFQEEMKRANSDAAAVNRVRIRAERAAARERRSLEQEAKTLIDATRTAQEKHSATVIKYGQLLKANLITQEQFQRAVAASGDEMKDMSKGPMAALIDQTKGMLAGWLSIQGAVKVVSSEIAAIQDRQKSAADAQKPYAEKLFEVAKNYDDVTPENLTKLDEIVKGISKKRGAKPSEVLDALNLALAGRVGGTVEEAIEATTVAVGLTSSSMEKGEIARSLLTEKSQYPDKSMKEIAGEQIAAKRLSPTVSDESFASHVSPHLSMAKQFGNTYAEAAAISSVFARRMADKEGRVSTNAFIALEQQLAELMPDVKGGTMEKIKALQTPQHKALREKLLGGMSDDWEAGGPLKSALEGERKAFIPMTGFVRGDKEILDEYESYLRQMPKDKKTAEGIVENLESMRETHPIMRGADHQRRFEADVEREKLADQQSKGSVNREYLRDKMKAVGGGAIEQWMTQFEFESATGVGTDKPATKVADILRKKYRALESPKDARPWGLDRAMKDYIYGPMLGIEKELQPATDADVEKAKNIREFLNTLKPLLEEEARGTPQRGGGEPINVRPPQSDSGVKGAQPVWVNVQVNMPGGGEKAPPVAAAAQGRQ